MVNSIFITDSYKMSHPEMLPPGTTLMYGNCTPRSNKYAPKGCEFVISMGQQILIKWLRDHFEDNFFSKPKEDVIKEVEEELTLHYGDKYNANHIAKLHDLGYLPIKFKSLPEGVKVPFGVPVMTWYNTHKDFAWLPLFLETPMSTMFWKVSTSATIAYDFRQTLTKYANLSDKGNLGFVDVQGHDFSARGHGGLDSSWLSGIGHLSSFLGSDTLASISATRRYYGDKGLISVSVPASEHSVSSACIGVMGELEMLEYYMDKFPKGFLSIVSDTLDLTKVVKPVEGGYLLTLKERILARDGKIVIRPDSCPAGLEPQDIICGHSNTLSSRELEADYPEFYEKGLVECLWDIFGGTINSQGYKVLNPVIGAIYGDSINKERAVATCERLMAKGFASTNIVFGIGSFTYQYNTRDTLGYAMKGVFCEVNGKSIEIFKDPITDDGTKKSAKGLLQVRKDNGEYTLKDQVTWEEEQDSELTTIFLDGELVNQTTLTEIRNRLKTKGNE